MKQHLFRFLQVRTSASKRVLLRRLHLALGRHLLATQPTHECEARCVRVWVCERQTPDKHCSTLHVRITVYLLKWSFYLHYGKCQCLTGELLWCTSTPFDHSQVSLRCSGWDHSSVMPHTETDFLCKQELQQEMWIIWWVFHRADFWL